MNGTLGALAPFRQYRGQPVAYVQIVGLRDATTGLRQSVRALMAEERSFVATWIAEPSVTVLAVGGCDHHDECAAPMCTCKRSGKA